MVTDRQTHTHTQNDYRNPTAHAPRVNQVRESESKLKIESSWRIRIHLQRIKNQVRESESKLKNQNQVGKSESHRRIGIKIKIKSENQNQD